MVPMGKKSRRRERMRYLSALCSAVAVLGLGLVQIYDGWIRELGVGLNAVCLILAVRFAFEVGRR